VRGSPLASLKCVDKGIDNELPCTTLGAGNAAARIGALFVREIVNDVENVRGYVSETYKEIKYEPVSKIELEAILIINVDGYVNIPPGIG